MDLTKYRTRSQVCLALFCFVLGITLGGLGVYLWFTNKSTKLEFNGIDKATIYKNITFGERDNEDVLKVALRPKSHEDALLLPQSDALSVVHKDFSKLWRINNEFESTVRSCLSDECYNAPVLHNDGIKRDRIGFLAPDPQGMQDLINLLNRAAKKDIASSFNVILDTHAPAYGYGKNHGWTRIVRFVHRVAPQAEAILRRQRSMTTKTIVETQTANIHYAASDPLPLSLYDLQIRQLVRWHCRLSHVAAHTRMLSVFVDDLVRRPVTQIYNILSFIGFRANRADILEAIATSHETALRGLGAGRLAVDTDAVEYPFDNNLVNTAVDAFIDELQTTDGLQKWPCQPLQRLDEQAGDTESRGLPLKASSLAANCSGQYVVCTVPIDKRGG